MITLKEIAAEAGVSVMTVSNVINNNTKRVSAETAQRIRAIIEKYHYVPNMAARSLISKESRIVALLLPLWERTASSLLLDPYTGQLAGMLEALLRQEGYYVMICSFDTVDQVLNMQRTWQMDGAILLLPHNDEITHALVERSETPLVAIDRRFDDLPMLSVCLEDYKGSYLATRYLLDHGHRDIGFAAPGLRTAVVIHDRFLGYMDALQEAGVTPREEWILEDCLNRESDETDGQRLLMLANRPTAMVCTSDLIACGFVKAYQTNGLKVPQDLSVVGFDNAMPARLITPGLTTIDQDIHEKALCAVRMLMDAIEDPNARDRNITIDVELVERGSVQEL